MQPFKFTYITGATALIDLGFDPVLSRYFDSPKAQVHEMIRQVNAAKYYAGVFPDGSDLTFLDIGANLGIVSLWAHPVCKRVVAVEPEPTTFVMLKSFLAKVAPIVECVSDALSNKTGALMLSIDRQDYSCHTAINPKPGNCSIKVEGFSFLDLLKRHNLESGIDVCKVDVEGAEMESLSDEVFASAPVKTWYIEVHKTPNMVREKSAVVMSARLKKAGFTVTSPRPNALVGKRP